MGLGINLPGLIAQIFNFLLLLGVLYVVLYKPVLRMLDRRAERIRESLEQAERVREQSQEAEERVREQVEAGRAEARQIVAQATAVAERVREEARVQARQEAEAIVARARAQAERELEEAMERLRSQFADLTITAAERVIGAAMDGERHRRLIDEVLRESAMLGRN